VLEKLKYCFMLIKSISASVYSSVQNTGTDNVGKRTREVTGKAGEHDRHYQTVFSLWLKGHSEFSSSACSGTFFANRSVLWSTYSVAPAGSPALRQWLSDLLSIVQYY